MSESSVAVPSFVGIPQRRASLTILVAVFTLTIFISAALLFLVQPMFARMVLPMLGGSPSVWNTTMVFYQAILLLGYGYAHLSTKWFGVRNQALAHSVLLFLPLLVLPIVVPHGWTPPSDVNPAPWLLGLLLVAVGLPFFVVSASSPLLQKWFAATGHPAAKDPYFLYAASNAGSLLALLSYPILLEPRLRLMDQSLLWRNGYLLFIACTLISVGFLWRHAQSPEAQTISSTRFAETSTLAKDDAPSNARRLNWVLLAFVPSSLMMSVTTYLSTDVAAVPLMWIVPLVLYLLTFILVFSQRQIIPQMLATRALALLILPLVVALASRANHPTALLLPLHLLVFFVITLVCHGQIVADRPSAQHLTEFYFWMSLGGVLGGAFNALLAPVLFSTVVEYPLTLVLACALALRPLATQVAPEKLLRSRVLDWVLPTILGLATFGLVTFLQKRLEAGPETTGLLFGIPAFACFVFSRRPLRFSLGIGAILLAGTFYLNGQGIVIYTARSFFGVHRVTFDQTGQLHQIVHGDTLHGSQRWLPTPQREAQAYYYRTGPLGQAFTSFQERSKNWKIAVVGLGAGGISSYAQRGQDWTFYEIDPVVEQIARNPKFFTYLRDCPAPLKVILGDGRLTLSRAQPASYDVLILDAYSSDSLPIHLLTRQAMQIYLSKLAPHGLMIFNISNRHLNIAPVLGNLSKDAGLVCLHQDQGEISAVEAARGKTASHFAVVARNRADLGTLADDQRWKPCPTSDKIGVWTDDFSSVFSVFQPS